jgi:TRAP-type C4-dicarboxylate transport system permease small subunit
MTDTEGTNALSALRRLFDKILDGAAFLAGTILALSVILICIDVAMRYFVRKPITGILESTEYGLVFLTLLAVAWLLRRDKHVRMDMVLKKLKPGMQAWVNGLTSAASTVICGIITYYGTIVVINCYRTGERFSSTLEPLSYPLMAIVPVCFFLLSVQSVRTTLGYFAEAKGLKSKTRTGGRAR